MNQAAAVEESRLASVETVELVYLGPGKITSRESRLSGRHLRERRHNFPKRSAKLPLAQKD